ncbi:MAG: hypothetical protein KAG34_09500 [Cocleimonas sp.]|nr:hypothetical protein [Cocleimonas sp.]
MLDYLFFNQSIADKFIDFMNENNLGWTQEVEKIQGALVLKTSEDIDDALWDALDERYDALGLQDALLSSNNSAEADDIDAAGVYLQLKNGQQTIAAIDPLIMNRILDVISMDEFNDFIEAIVSSVENPDDSAICQKKT